MQHTKAATLLTLPVLAVVSLVSDAARSDHTAPATVTNDTVCSPANIADIPIADLYPPIATPIGTLESSLWRTTQPYNPPINHPQVYKSLYGHNGEDLGGDYGGTDQRHELVRAMFEGQVIVSKSLKGWGNTVVVASRLNSHSNALITIHYHHLHERYVGTACNQIVAAGELIGTEGATGGDYDKHLHLTVKYWANLEHLNTWIAAGTQMLVGPGAYHTLNGKKFRGWRIPDSNGANIDYNSPYIHYGHLDPEPLAKDYFIDYGNGSVDPNAPYAWSNEYAKKMRYYGIELGEWDGAFGSGLPVSRREVARWIKIALGDEFYGAVPTGAVFADVPFDDPDFDYIQALTVFPPARPVIDPDGTFNVNDLVNRAEAIKLIVLAFYSNEYMDFWAQYRQKVGTSDFNVWLTSVTGTDLQFLDIDPADWYASYAYFGASLDIVALDIQHLYFQPQDGVVRAEMAKWIILGYEVLHGEGVSDPCDGVVCSSGQYCSPFLGQCVPVAECVPTVDEPCPAGGPVIPENCGDGTCSADEACDTCPEDCGVCPPSCPDGQCNGSEDCGSCPQDCGTCPPGCPDGVCDQNESCDVCPQDCGECPCVDSYIVTQYGCQTFSSASGAGAGGGEIIEICMTSNVLSGDVTVTARKYDGTNFGNRPYQVRVSDPQDPSCGPDTYFFVVSDSNPTGIGTSELTFNFQSIWEPGQTAKGYCVTASTVPGDVGYQNVPEQTSWWYSDKAILEKQCI